MKNRASTWFRISCTESYLTLDTGHGIIYRTSASTMSKIGREGFKQYLNRARIFDSGVWPEAALRETKR